MTLLMTNRVQPIACNGILNVQIHNVYFPGPYFPMLWVNPINATSINITWWLFLDVKTGPETYFNLTITDDMNATWIVEEHVEGTMFKSSQLYHTLLRSVCNCNCMPNKNHEKLISRDSSVGRIDSPISLTTECSSGANSAQN